MHGRGVQVIVKNTLNGALLTPRSSTAVQLSRIDIVLQHRIFTSLGTNCIATTLPLNAKMIKKYKQEISANFQPLYS